MNGEIAALGAFEAARLIRQGELSAEGYATACLERVALLEETVGAFAHLDPSYVLEQARALDERRTEGRPLGPLHGVPVGIKDIIDTADYPTECGSRALQGRRPARDASVVTRLRAAGAVIFGKTVTTEVAYRHPGKTRNPHDPERTPGGSSSGSAAAVAAAMLPLALGTQTAGSVIRPASYCGVFGLKPSHGLIGRSGVLLHSHKLDHLGVYARDLEDIALIMDVVAGFDSGDKDSRAIASPAFARTLAEPLPAAPNFAFVRTPMWDKADADTREAFEELVAALGASVRVVDLPDSFAGAWEAHRIVMMTDMAHAHAELVARGGDANSEPLRRQVASGAEVPAVTYLRALDDAARYADSLADIFRFYDAIITPASPGVAPKGIDFTGDPVFNALWTLTGLPAISLPLLRGESGMPIGVQLVGAMGHDGRLLRTANALLAQLREMA